MEGIQKILRIHFQAVLSTFSFAATLEMVYNELLKLPFIESLFCARHCQLLQTLLILHNAHSELQNRLCLILPIKKIQTWVM